MISVISFITASMAANFAYQWMQDDPIWIAAIERSYFQSIAVIIYWLVWVRGSKNGNG